MKRKSVLIFLLLFLISCMPASNLTSQSFAVTEEFFLPATFTLEPFTATLPSPTSTSTELPSPTALPIVESMRAIVLADKLVCRYGPGANYLYLFAYNGTARIKLIGQAVGNQWVLVENEPQRCWVNSDYLQVEGNTKQLPSMYPDGYTIPVSPYYGPTSILTTTREGDEITVSWIEVYISPGKYEDENMFPYIVEVWHCVDGEFIFETIGSRYPALKFVDQQGCAEPSHGRLYIQEKHGYAGPTEIPWPAR